MLILRSKWLCFAGAMLLVGLAQAACWQGDENSGELRFSGRIEGESFYGSFGEFEVRVCRPEGSGWSESQWAVRVMTASADTRNRDRDDTLHGRYFFAVDEFPAANWTSARVVEQSDGLEIEGNLDLRGFTAAQTVEVEVNAGDDGLLLVGSAEIPRLDYGVGQGEYADTEFIRNRVDLEFELRLTRE